MNQNMHENDRRQLASQLKLDLAVFDELVKSANKAFETYCELGPFYGRSDIKEPTFRVTARPVVLPKGSQKFLQLLGEDLLSLGRTLWQLPPKYKDLLGGELDFSLPFSWRIDAILDERDNLKVNEVEGQDGASALMVAEQIAYGLQSLEESTAAKFAQAIKNRTGPKKPIKVAFLRVNNPHNVNADKFIELVGKVAGNGIVIDHLFDEDIRKEKNADFSKYDWVISESSLSPKELQDLKVPLAKLLTFGNFSALTNKGVFALLWEDELLGFWKQSLGESYERLRGTLIPTYFIYDRKGVHEARKQGKVAKVSWAGANTSLINRSRGVALSEGDIEQSRDERWKSLEESVGAGFKVIAQDFVMPAKIKSFLKKKAFNLEPVSWYNRICAKYVVDRDTVHLTAQEATLGPEIIPAGRKCAFTAASFEEIV